MGVMKPPDYELNQNILSLRFLQSESHAGTPRMSINIRAAHIDLLKT